MSFEKTKWVWQNGKFLRWDEAKIHSSAFGLHYGVGVFEGIRCYETDEGPAVFRLKEHMDRLSASAQVYQLDIPYSQDELNEAICETIRRNEFKSCYIRPTAYFDSGSLGIRAICPVGVNILTWEWPNDFGAEKLAKGMRVTVSPYKKFHSSMIPTTAKATGNYLNSILAVREAASRGYDEAILLDMHGNLAEGAVENVFLVKNGRLLTNDQNSSILLGITRDSAMRIARDLGYEVEVRALKLDELLDADEAFLTGTAIEITPIREVDGRAIGAGARGPVTEAIQKTFFDVVSGRKSEYLHWLRPVWKESGARKAA
ncbi:MAG TPA: branched-chain amino acid transaminase [Blastocatellia bacterium]|jgi:branched-chain amino acid aminotransferase|nr:branched-chain amino acid transaminase [Blastocatellia bacterium]